MVRGLREHPESFRIDPGDPGEPLIPFFCEGPGDFTLGAFEEDGTLIGAVSFSRERRRKLEHKGLLYRMYVRADRSGKGIGRMLVREVVARASEIPGLERINLTVVAANSSAKRLYTSEGFRSFGREEQGLKIGGAYIEEEQMSLPLPKGRHPPNDR